MNFTKAVAILNKPVGDYYYNKLTLQVTLPHNFVVGQTVAVNGSVYKGNFKITYIYNNASSKITALYFGDILFKGNDAGTIESSVNTNTVANNGTPGANISRVSPSGSNKSKSYILIGSGLLIAVLAVIMFLKRKK